MKTPLRLTAASLLLAALALTGNAHSGADEIVVIAHPSTSVGALSESDLRPIFQTTKTSWEGGTALPLNLPDSDAARRGFDAAVLGLDPDRVARYWVDRKIRGGNPPPKNVANASLILKVVASKPGAIGYVPASSLTSQVKVVARIRGGAVFAP
jgi:ABC-type phosphate transport system substrate-binding protein